MRPLIAVTVVAAALAAAVAAGARTSPTSAAATAAGVNCKKSATIGYFGPTTGPAASIGQELRLWPLYYVRRWNAGKKNFPKIRVIEGDTQFDPSQVSTIAQQFASNSKILGVSGPGASQEVLAAGPIFTKAKVPFVVASATRTTLSNGQFPTFFRIAPPDAVQARTSANYMITDLKVKKVFVVDDQSAYSVPLADAVQDILKQKGISTSRESVTQKQSDFSSVVSKIARDTSMVYMPLQLPAEARLFAQQMKEHGLNMPVFSSDAGYSPDFNVEGAYFSTFGPDIRDIKKDKGLISTYHKFYGKNAPLTTFGPLSYLTAQVLVGAVAKACKDGRATRGEVLANIRKTNISTKASPINERIKFTAHGDVVGARFFIFKIINGKPHYIK